MATFKGSIAESTTKSRTKDQLLNSRRYCEMAINAHTQKRNNSEILFFTENMKLIDTLLKSKS